MLGEVATAELDEDLLLLASDSLPEVRACAARALAAAQHEQRDGQRRVFVLGADDVARDREVRAVLITGAGRAFCTGQDLNDRLQELQTALQEARTEEERAEIRRRLKRLAIAVLALQPYIGGTPSPAVLVLAALFVGALGAYYHVLWNFDDKVKWDFASTMKAAAGSRPRTDAAGSRPGPPRNSRRSLPRRRNGARRAVEATVPRGPHSAACRLAFNDTGPRRSPGRRR